MPTHYCPTAERVGLEKPQQDQPEAAVLSPNLMNAKSGETPVRLKSWRGSRRDERLAHALRHRGDSRLHSEPTTWRRSMVARALLTRDFKNAACFPRLPLFPLQ